MVYYRPLKNGVFNGGVTCHQYPGWAMWVFLHMIFLK